MKATHELA